MKINSSFISNSSSTAFIITNKTNDILTLTDFINDTEYVIYEFSKEYKWEEKAEILKAKMLLEAAEMDLYTFKPGEKKYSVFGDEQGTTIGRVYDYALRNDGETARFKWKFKELLR
jgi:hypothetical protein